MQLTAHAAFGLLSSTRAVCEGANELTEEALRTWQVTVRRSRVCLPRCHEAVVQREEGNGKAGISGSMLKKVEMVWRGRRNVFTHRMGCFLALYGRSPYVRKDKVDTHGDFLLVYFNVCSSLDS